MKTIEEILAIDDAHRREVEVPEWDTTLLVVSMNAEERAEIEKRWAKRVAAEDPAAFRADMLTHSLKNADGTPFGTPEQIKQLLKKNAEAVERLFEVACEISAFSKKDVEAIEKN